MRKFITLTVIFLILIFWGTSAVRQWRADVYFNRAQLSSPSIFQSPEFPNDSITQSLNHLKKAIALDPSNAEYHYQLAKAHSQILQKNLKEGKWVSVSGKRFFECRPKTIEHALNALNSYQKTITYNPTNAYAHMGLGWIIYQLSWLSVNSDLLSKNTKDFTKEITQILDRPSIVRNYFKTATMLAPSDAYVHYSLGYYLLTQKSLKQSTEPSTLHSGLLAFKKAIQIDPGYTGTIINTLWSQKIGYETLIEVIPDTIGNYSQLYKFMLNKGAFDEALIALKYFDGLKIKKAAELVKSGERETRKGRHEDAAIFYQQAYSLDPTNIFALFRLGKYEGVIHQAGLQGIKLADRVNIDRMRSYFQAQIAGSTDPNSSISSYYLGRCYEEQGRIDVALNEYKEVLKTNPNHFNTLVKLEKSGIRTIELSFTQSLDYLSTKKISRSEWPNQGNLYSNGRITKKVNLLKGKVRFFINMRGTPAEGVYPYAIARLDERILDGFCVDSESFVYYYFESEIEAGSHHISIEFTNDLYLPKRGEDRNLFVGDIIITPGRLNSPAAFQ